MDDRTVWSFSSLPELHSRFGWEEYLVLTLVLIISVLIGNLCHHLVIPYRVPFMNNSMKV